jgi:hypothetical protein
MELSWLHVPRVAKALRHLKRASLQENLVTVSSLTTSLNTRLDFMTAVYIAFGPFGLVVDSTPDNLTKEVQYCYNLPKHCIRTQEMQRLLPPFLPILL